MLKVAINPWENRLTIIVHKWTRTDMPRYVEQIESACNTLLPGFACLAFCRNHGRLTSRDRQLLLKTSDLISAYGAGRVILITPRSPRRVHRHPAADVVRIPIEVVPDMEVAETRLQGHPE